MSNRGLAQLATAWREVALRLWKGIYLHRSWDGEYEDAAILVAIAVNEDGCQSQAPFGNTGIIFSTFHLHPQQP